ncbi:MAG TPA: hypothetical protein VJB70_02620 [Candidatus Paceibacterota bacterium]
MNVHEEGKARGLKNFSLGGTTKRQEMNFGEWILLFFAMFGALVFVAMLLGDFK